MMRLSLIVVGIVVGVLGVLSVWSAGSWTMWWGIVSIPSPLAFLRPLNPYAHYFVGFGVMVFLVGLFLNRGD